MLYLGMIVSALGHGGLIGPASRQNMFHVQGSIAALQCGPRGCPSLPWDKNLYGAPRYGDWPWGVEAGASVNYEHGIGKDMKNLDLTLPTVATTLATPRGQGTNYPGVAWTDTTEWGCPPSQEKCGWGLTVGAPWDDSRAEAESKAVYPGAPHDLPMVPGTTPYAAGQYKVHLTYYYQMYHASGLGVFRNAGANGGSPSSDYNYLCRDIETESSCQEQTVVPRPEVFRPDPLIPSRNVGTFMRCGWAGQSEWQTGGRATGLTFPEGHDQWFMANQRHGAWSDPVLNISTAPTDRQVCAWVLRTYGTGFGYLHLGGTLMGPRACRMHPIWWNYMLREMVRRYPWSAGEIQTEAAAPKTVPEILEHWSFHSPIKECPMWDTIFSRYSGARQTPPCVFSH